MLRNALLPYESMVAGLMVQRLFTGGVMCGFRACAVDGTLPPVDEEYSVGMEGVFLFRGQSFPHVLEKAISTAFANCQKEHCKMILLDEIGGLELLSNAFMTPLQKILALDKPCAGILKSRDNLAHTAERLSLPPHVLTLRDDLQKQLESNGTVATMNHENRKEIERSVIRFVEDSLESLKTSLCK